MHPSTPTSSETARAIEPLLVRVEVAARMLSLSRSTVYEMLASGELPSVRRGSARRVPTAAIRAWVSAQLENPVAGM